MPDGRPEIERRPDYLPRSPQEEFIVPLLKVAIEVQIDRLLLVQSAQHIVELPDRQMRNRLLSPPIQPGQRAVFQGPGVVPRSQLGLNAAAQGVRAGMRGPVASGVGVARLGLPGVLPNRLGDCFQGVQTGLRLQGARDQLG